MPDIDHLSYSSISTYLLCPRAWAYRYVDRVTTPSSPSLVFGSAVHGAVERMIRCEHAGTTYDPAEIWREAWGDATRGEVAWEADIPEEHATTGQTLVCHPDTRATVRALLPLVVDGALAIEQRVELRVPGVPIPVIGFIDLITADGVVTDFKTAGKAWTEEKARAEEQPSFYLAALNQAGFTLNPEGQFRHVVWVKAAKPRVQVFVTRRSPQRLFRLFELIGQVWRGIEAGCFPAQTNTWKCAPRWCEYWARCPYGGRA